MCEHGVFSSTFKSRHVVISVSQESELVGTEDFQSLTDAELACADVIAAHSQELKRKAEKVI